MSKALKIALISIGGLILLLFIGFKIMQSNTKKHSPEQIVELKENGFDLEVFYNRPYKKDRVIFGELVPFGEVWRTGANEATTFTTANPVTVGGTILQAGTYTLWTIPGGTEWEVIFNSKMYGWGVSFGAKASREAEFDVANITVPASKGGSVIEQFTIDLSTNEVDKATMTLQWDKTRVAVPIEAAK